MQADASADGSKTDLNGIDDHRQNSNLLVQHKTPRVREGGCF
jgi:hypothetical protein